MTGEEIRIVGKFPERVIVTESGQPPVTADLQFDGIYQGGFANVPLSGKKITSITVASPNPVWSFAIDEVWLIERQTSSGSPSPPDYCGVATMQRPAPENHSAYGWTMHSEVSDADGLVLSDVRLNGRLMAERISVPYYKIETNSIPPFRGELRPNDASGDLRSRLVNYRTEINDERLIVTATYAIDNISPSQSCLTITQRYEFTRLGLNAPCEPNDSIPCQQYRALVSYNFVGNGETLRSLNIAQRNHFTVNGANKNSVGLFRDCDGRFPVIGCLPNLGIIFKDKINPLFTEYYSPVIVNGKDNHLWDNMHQTLQSSVTEPPSGLVHWVLGGCPECLHTHWRWGASLGDHFGSGKLLLPDYTNQDLSIGIVRNRAGEEHPYDFLDLIVGNSEPIRSKLTGIDLMTPNHYKYTVPEDVVYWLLAKGYKDSDEFFSHYSFFNPDSPNVTQTIQNYPLFAAKASLKKEINSASLNQDLPTTIVFGHLYKNGATTYREIDPNTVAQLPAGYVAYNGVSYDIRTEAEVSGPHTVTFNLPSVADQTTFGSLRVLHSEPDPFDSSRAVWVDRTILAPDAPAPNFANRNIGAKVNHVGPFIAARFTPPPPNTNIADLSVSISDSADPIAAGNQLTYTINVTNNGTDAATGVVFNDGLSPDVLFVSASATQGICREEDATVICNLDTIASGASVPVTIVVEPNEGQSRFPTDGKTIANTAFVRANENDPDQSNNSDTESTNAQPNADTPPVVKILAPAADGIMTAPTDLEVTLEAYNSVGGTSYMINQVELFQDGQSVGSCFNLPPGSSYCSVTVNGAAPGEHSLIALATNNGGRKAVSDPVNFFVNGPATVYLDSPAENTLFGRPANIALTATAANQSGSISKVEFLANGEPIGNGVLSGTNQYNFTWNNAPTGTILLRAVATDGNGVKSYSYATKIYITNAPVVTIASPTSGASYPKHSNIAFTANARDFDGYVSKVEFFANGTIYIGDGTLVQSDLYTFNWMDAPVGTRTITAVATDNSRQTSSSNPINVTVTNVAPTVSMTNPVGGATFTAPASITLSANAADTDGTISKIEFFNGAALLGTVLSPPYNFSWMNVAAGSYSLTAKATDDDGAAITSSAVSITVNPVGSALFVVGNTTLSAVDTAIKTRLQNLGLTVVIKSAATAVSTDATGKRVVVISDSVAPTSVNTKFRAVTVPVVTLSSQLFDDMGMCSTTSGNFGTTAAQKNVTITNASHPMAGGLSGTVQVTSATTTFGWGKLNANGVKIAALTTDSTKATDFGYEANSVMPGLTAPKRRVGFFYAASSTSLTTSGGLLFDNAIKWAAGL